MKSPFNGALFRKLLPSWDLCYYEETSSTNLKAMEAVKAGEVQSGTVFVADKQTLGVGRRGTPWQSQARENLLFSAVIETELPPVAIGKVAIAAGLVLAEKLAKYSDSITVKWPNDIYIENKKVAGILVQHVDGFSVIGVGLNVFTTDFPVELNATSLLLEATTELSREDILISILQGLLEKVSLCEYYFPQILKQLEPFDRLSDHWITYKEEGAMHQAKVLGIAEDASLIVLKNGKTRYLTSVSEIQIIKEPIL